MHDSPIDTKAKVYLTSDHGGFELKNSLLKYLESKGIEVEDLGPDVLDPQDDYPDFVLTLVKKIKQDDNGVGLVACRSAQGVAIAANRNPGIRAAVAWSEAEAKKSREHNNANVLCLSGDFVDEATNKQIVDAWLGERFSDEPRHSRRLRKIESYFPL